MSQDVISVYAPVHYDPADSYGLIASELVRNLTRLDLHVNAHCLGYSEHPNQDDDLRKLVLKPILPAAGGLLLGYPTIYEHYGNLANISPKIAITMFESTRIPNEWIEPLNSCDAIIVPSIFVAEAFRDSGVEKSIFVFPLGIDPLYTYQERKWEDETFTFLAFLDRGKRKGGLYALEAFNQEFSSYDNVKLILKHKEIKNPNKPKLIFEDCNIETMYGDFTPAELRDLYYSCHCLINPNKGEGFGLIPREFAATGGISLSTDWGGTADLNHLWGWPIDYTLQKADWQGIEKFEGRDLGYWAEPSIPALRDQLRSVYENREEYLYQAKRKAFFARDYYDWYAFAVNVWTIWKGLRYGVTRASESVSA